METLLTLIVLLYPVSEVALAFVKRARREVATIEDRGSMRLLWLTIIAPVALAAVCAGRHLHPGDAQWTFASDIMTAR